MCVKSSFNTQVALFLQGDSSHGFLSVGIQSKQNNLKKKPLILSINSSSLLLESLDTHLLCSACPLALKVPAFNMLLSSTLN